MSNQSDKNLLFSYLNSLFSAHKKLYSNPKMPVDNTYADMIKLFMAAYNNRYLIDENNKRERKIRNDWYAKANELARTILSKDPSYSLKLEPMYGEYIWLNDTFENLGEGSVTFEAIGQNDAMVCFSAQPARVRNTTKQIYEISIGAWDNTKTVVRTKSLGKTVAETNHPDMRCKIVKSNNDPNATKYWISVSKGKVVMGKGDLTPKNAIGIFDVDTGTVSNVEWEDAEIVPTSKALSLLDTEEALMGFSKVQAELIALAKLFGAQPFDVNGYLVALEKVKQQIQSGEYPKSLELIQNLPDDSEKYSDHLGSLLETLNNELNELLGKKYIEMIKRLKEIIGSGKKYERLLKVLRKVPKDVSKYGEHMAEVLTALQSVLPKFLTDNPPYEYKKVGGYKPGKEPFYWQDPYPIRNIKYVGISTWDAPVEFSKIIVGPKVEEADLYKANLIAKIKAIRGEPLSKIIEHKDNEKKSVQKDSEKRREQSKNEKTSKGDGTKS